MSIDKDSICYGCQFVIDNENCNAPTICAEGHLNFTTIKELFKKNVLTEREIRNILAYYLSAGCHIDWFGCVGVSDLFHYEYIENYKKDNQVTHKFNSEYQLR